MCLSVELKKYAEIPKQKPLYSVTGLLFPFEG